MQVCMSGDIQVQVDSPYYERSRRDQEMM